MRPRGRSTCARSGHGEIGGEGALDSEDDPTDDESSLVSFESALVSGMSVAPAPQALQLEFKNPAGKDLKDAVIMYNWIGVGWCVGRIRRQSADKNKLVKVNGQREPANFMVAYEDGEGPHCALDLGKVRGRSTA